MMDVLLADCRLQTAACRLTSACRLTGYYWWSHSSPIAVLKEPGRTLWGGPWLWGSNACYTSGAAGFHINCSPYAGPALL